MQNEQIPAPGNDLPRSLVVLLAVATGMGAASLYYSQPMLGSLGNALGGSTRDIGWIPTLTQLGYGLGILLLAPLGDRFDRRTIILIKMALLVVALLAASASGTLAVMLVASFGVGIAATVAQDIVPAAATLAPEVHRGRVVGAVMTGLFLGILLSRVASGLVAEGFGWRTVFVGAAGLVAVVGLTLWWRLPQFRPTTDLPYRKLLGSMASLWVRHRELRRAALAQGFLSVGFSAFWSTLAVMLVGNPFHVGSGVAGLFGLAGAAGALAAPVAGRLADRKGPAWVVRLGTLITLVSFVGLAAGSLLPPGPQMIVLVIGVVTFDLGVQMSLVAHQAIIYSIDPGSRSRLNAVLLTTMFGGMAVGSAVGSLCMATGGWMGVMLFTTVAGAAALVVRLGNPLRGRFERGL